ncbi:zinc finger protein 287 [Bactrocera neohumeralis]|uniref:zinc finger protein 287 n=1 Tax=Bactrocera neohumeralis TaxID=98809 RepID=UPI002164F74B|nr:zinc finger protein 287 [Bactrocera neohumeralis]
MNNQLTRNNLQEFCRTCLSSLQKRRRREKEDTPTSFHQLKVKVNQGDNENDSETNHSYNLSLLPQLQKLFMLFTSLEISEDSDEDAYPRSLCQLCYEKMIDFQEFRNLAINSAEVLYKIVNSLDDEMSKTSAETPTFQTIEITKEIKTETVVRERSYQFNDDDDDDQLLLPELAPLMERPIKTEPENYYKSESETILPNDDNSENSSNIVVKHEIDSEYEEDNSLFYERNALSAADNSISDDADDEEHALRNGAANTSSMSLNNSPITVGGRQRFSASSRKRDRNKKSLKCPRCDKQVYKKVYLDAHIRAVHEGFEKPFLCLECQKDFTRYEHLHTHIQSKHLIKQRFICGLNGCDAVFKLSNTLETHRQVVHTATFSYGLQDMLELHQAQLNEEVEINHICQHCFKTYSSKRALSEHLKRHAQIKDHVCKVCGVAKVTRTELLTHMRIHKPNLEKFKCSICPQEFNHKNAISRHVRVVHEGQRRFPCSFCPKRFGTRNSQVCHERLHTGERPFNCELCHKRYAQVEGLKSHMKSHDKNLRTHVCSFCSQRFITRKNLIDHEKRHQSDKPHICNTCSRGFFSIEDLGVHKQSHTEEELREMARNEYELYQDAGDSLGEHVMETESINEQGSQAYMGYSSSQSSN